MELEKLKSIVESLLFISGDPIKLSRIAKAAGVARSEVESAIEALQDEYAAGKGFAIIRKEDDVQMTTSPDNASYIADLVKSEVQENLSQAGLEVLSIVAYRGPITRAEVEAIRGVNSSFTIRALLLRGLLERVENPKDARSYLYKISFEFLKRLGIDEISKLPDFEALAKDDRVDSIIEG